MVFFKNIFKNAFEKIKYNEYSNILLIVSINLQNKNGSENITINSKYKKKKGTKLSIITNTIVLFYQYFLLK